MRKYPLFALATLLSACQSPTAQQPSVPDAAAGPISSSPTLAATPSAPNPTPAPTGHYLYVADYYTDGVTVLSIESDGSLSFVQQTGAFYNHPFMLGVGTNPNSSNPGPFLYLYTCLDGFPGSSCTGIGQIDQMQIDQATGRISLINPLASLFTAEGQGAVFNGPVTSAISGSTTYTINAQGLVDRIQGGKVLDSYSAGSTPVSLFIF